MLQINQHINQPKIIVSYDPGRCNMGVCVAEINLKHELPDIKIILNKCKNIEEKFELLSKSIEYISNILNKIIKIIYIDCVNVTDTTDISDLAPKLSACITNIHNKIKISDKEIDYLVYEFQMNMNDKSRAISTMLIYHYLQNNKTKCIRSMPTSKNKISITPEHDHRNFIKKYANCKSANKHHCASSMIYWMKLFGVSIDHIGNKKDDAGDAFMQILSNLHLIII